MKRAFGLLSLILILGGGCDRTEPLPDPVPEPPKAVEAPMAIPPSPSGVPPIFVAAALDALSSALSRPAPDSGAAKDERSWYAHWDPSRVVWTRLLLQRDRKTFRLEGVGRTNEDIAEFLSRLNTLPQVSETMLIFVEAGANHQNTFAVAFMASALDWKSPRPAVGDHLAVLKQVSDPAAGLGVGLAVFKPMDDVPGVWPEGRVDIEARAAPASLSRWLGTLSAGPVPLGLERVVVERDGDSLTTRFEVVFIRARTP